MLLGIICLPLPSLTKLHRSYELQGGREPIYVVPLHWPAPGTVTSLFSNSCVAWDKLLNLSGLGFLQLLPVDRGSHFTGLS